MSWFKRFRRQHHDVTFLIVGLGNPGSDYAHTRHNAGFDVCSRLAANGKAWRRAQGAHEWRGAIAGSSVVLLKPRTYVNASGPPVRHALRTAGLGVDRLIVVHDDLDLGFARVRVRKGGSSGGHRGVASILDALGDSYFLRVKIGIGRPLPGMDPSDYVLQRFGAAEREAADDALDRATDAVRALLTRPLEDVMREVGQRDAAVQPRA